jgi:hypothetical protein
MEEDGGGAHTPSLQLYERFDLFADFARFPFSVLHFPETPLFRRNSLLIKRAFTD